MKILNTINRISATTPLLGRGVRGEACALAAIFLLLCPLFRINQTLAQNRIDSVSFNHTEMNGGDLDKTLKIGFDNCGSITYIYRAINIYAYLYTGNDYTYGSQTHNDSVKVKLDLYNTTSGSSGLIRSKTYKLKINQNAPEQLALWEVGNDIDAGPVRIEATIQEYGSTVLVQGTIKLAVYYKDDVGMDVSGLAASTVTTNNITIKNPVKFHWNTTNKCIPNYQFQLIRLFNTDSVNAFVHKDEKRLIATLDWNKAMTIETNSPDTFITLTLAEGRGYYAWRVRPIGTYYNGGITDSRNWGNWNSNSLAQGYSFNITAPAADNKQYFFYHQFDDDKNWSYSRTFSEGDPMNPKVRMSETMTYASNLRQVKQTQAKVQSLDTMVVNQTFYDYSGRPAVNSLATPIPRDTFGYYNQLLKVGSNLYTATYFDEDNNFRSPTAADGGQLNSYYSNSNSDLTVPNAEGYPYSRVLYERDGTGRVVEQAGPGETHRMKTSTPRTTIMLDAGVSDAELVRVFGDEAPEANSTYKKLTIDPNKTATIEYISKEGQTIATALSINIDSTGATLDTVPGYRNSRVLIKDTVWGNSPFGSFGITSNKPLVFATPTYVTFKYVINKKDIKHLCQNYCSTCDYNIEFLLHSDDTTIIIKKRLLPADLCSNPHRYDTTFTKLLDAGKKYIFEKRVYAGNTKPGTSNPAKTYLDIHTDSLRTTLQKRADDSLAVINGFLKRNSMDSLYRYLNNGTFLNFNVTNPDSVFADSVFTKNIGCTKITIPVTFCYKYDCPVNNRPDFEKYFNDRWAGTAYDDESGTGYIDFLVPPYGQSTYRFQKGQFNFLVYNMINSGGYNCQDLWKCWDRLTQGYESMKKMADTTTSQYSFDMFEEFMRCAKRKLKDHHATDTSKFLGKAYEYFYKPASTATCDTLLKHTYGTLGGWAQDSLDPVKPENKRWENYYSCTRYGKQGTAKDLGEKTALARCGCASACEARYEGFKLSVINMFHNDSIYVQGDKFKLKKDTIWGQKYGWSTDTLVDQPQAANYRTMAQVECMARNLVEYCMKSCEITTYDTLSTKKMGTAAQQEAMKKAMTWGYELKRVSDGTSCGAGFTKVGPNGNSSLDASSDTLVSVLWQKHYGSDGEERLWDIVETKRTCGGYLLAGWTDKTSIQHDITGTNRGIRDYWIVKVNDFGERIWDTLIGGSSGDSLYSIQEMIDGSILLGGSSRSGVSGDKSQASQGGHDYWIVKLDPHGKKLWDKTYGGTSNDYLKYIIETDNGQILAGGYSNSATLAGNKTDNNYNNSYDYWVIKLDKNGNRIWDNIMGSNDDDKLMVIKETLDGKYILAGSSAGGATGDKSQASQGNVDYWVVKIDTAGNKVWDKRFGGSQYDYLMGITQARDSSYVLAGSVNSTNGDKTDNLPTTACGGNSGYDYWIVKIKEDGSSITWNKTFGSCNDETKPDFGERYMDIKQIHDGSYLIGGSSGSPSNTYFGTILKRELACCDNEFDYWVIKIDSLGVKKWDKVWGANDVCETNDIFTALDQDEEGYYWIAGYSDGSNTCNKTVTNYGTTTNDWWVLRARDKCSGDSVCIKWVDNTRFPLDSITIYLNFLSCDSVNSGAVYNVIMQQVQEYIGLQLDSLRLKYMATCANADSIQDTLSLSYTQGVYHFTLYYYDRAGNLVRTVPPAGVVTYTGTRSNGTTAHTFKTKYKYNSLKQLVEQFTPDGDTVKFWYDYKAQLRFSMNIKQKMAGVYSYTKYDNLGRITEVGESSKNFSTFTDSLNAPKFPTSATLNKQRTYTVYSTAASGITFRNNSPQRYLQNRVSYAYTDDNIYTYYSYDPHGNVEWLIQDIPNLGKNYVRYEYDLISNKVLAVHYNEGTIDEFHHKYSYDEDQRIKTAATSWAKGSISPSNAQPTVIKRNNVGWDRDATYKYFLHGPLKRSEIGEDKLQGLDYVYTINGWIKGINYPTLLKNDDPGQDSVTFGKDVFGMVVGYHSNDFNRSGSKYNPATPALVSSLTSPTGNPGAYLYNGNISNWTISRDSVDNTNYNKRKGFLYRYDQLNRIKTEDYYDWSYEGAGWSGVANSDYNNSYTFDGNGNIITLKRNAFGGTNTMDDQTYVYKNGYNRLTHIDDVIAAGNQTVDIDDQSANNYVYDSIGNLTKDVQEGIDNIEWTVYGKVKSVKKSNGDSLIFQYDASGNKIMKYLKKSGQNPYVTYYVRDAQGNIMSTYSRETSGSNYLYKQKELILYGSEQLGILKPGTTLKSVPISGASNCLSCANCDYTIDITRSTGLFTRNLKKKEYELKDHLSNVRATISDRKKVNGIADSILSYSTYYAYGMKLPSTAAGTIKNYNQRTAEDNGTGYSFGYNGKEQDFSFHDDDGQMYDYGFRIYDPRMARFLSVDPLFQSYPHYTPYQFSGNMPIWAIDLDGLEQFIVINIYDSRKRLKSTVIKVVQSNKAHDLTYEDHNLYNKKDKSDVTEKKVLIINKYSDGKETTEERNVLNKREKKIMSKKHEKSRSTVRDNPNGANSGSKTYKFETPTMGMEALKNVTSITYEVEYEYHPVTTTKYTLAHSDTWDLSKDNLSSNNGNFLTQHVASMLKKNQNLVVEIAGHDEQQSKIIEEQLIKNGVPANQIIKSSSLNKENSSDPPGGSKVVEKGLNIYKKTEAPTGQERQEIKEK